MTTGLLGRYAVAVLLVLASLGSAPMGSMEQAGRVGEPTSAQATSVPAAHPRTSIRVEVRGFSGRAPRPGDLPRLFLPAPLAEVVLPLARLARPHDPGGCAGPAPVAPLCERLPYQANAPPALS